MNELKPCPFCPDGKVRTFIGKREAGVLCSCGASVLLPYGTYVSEDEALCQCIKRWHTRHYPPEVQQAMERLKPVAIKPKLLDEYHPDGRVYLITCENCKKEYKLIGFEFSDAIQHCGK